jgi:DNA-binding NarL/FixJ family response regulator
MDHPERLTEREDAVLRLIALGYSGNEIAGRLDASPNTVEARKNRACEKLGIRSRADLVRYAVIRGWIVSR